MNDRGAFEHGFAHIHTSGESTMYLTKCSPREPWRISPRDLALHLLQNFKTQLVIITSSKAVLAQRLCETEDIKKNGSGM